MSTYTVVSPKDVSKYFQDEAEDRVSVLWARNCVPGQLVVVVDPNGNVRLVGMTAEAGQVRGFVGLDKCFGGHQINLSGRNAINCLVAERFEKDDSVYIHPRVKVIKQYWVGGYGGRKDFSTFAGIRDDAGDEISANQWIPGRHIFLVIRQDEFIGSGFVEDNGRGHYVFSSSLAGWCRENEHHGATELLAERLWYDDELWVVELAT